MLTACRYLLAGSLLLAACAGPQADLRRARYEPVFATGAADETAKRGTLKGDYDWARGATEAREAVTRWEQFLKAHSPSDGEYEDGFEKLHVEAAKYELMRVYYLVGERQKGDALLRELDPLGIR